MFTESSANTYFLVKNGNGETVFIKKKSFCWLLNGEHDKLSNDRTIRFQSKKASKNDNPQSSVVNQSEPQPDEKIVNIGDWCQFRYEKEIIIGQVFSFLVLNKKTKKESRYSKQFAIVSDNKVGVLANWFVVQKDKFKLKIVETFIPITNYVKHIKKPDNNSLIYK